MGDRASFGIQHSNGDRLFVYGHWAGYGMLKRFASALNKAIAYKRIDDEAYGTRIIVESLMSDAYSPDLGWGITMNQVYDNEHKIPVFNFEDGTVSLYPDESFGEPLFTMKVISFVNKYL